MTSRVASGSGEQNSVALDHELNDDASHGELLRLHGGRRFQRGHQKHLEPPCASLQRCGGFSRLVIATDSAAHFIYSQVADQDLLPAAAAAAAVATCSRKPPEETEDVQRERDIRAKDSSSALARGLVREIVSQGKLLPEPQRLQGEQSRVDEIEGLVPVRVVAPSPLGHGQQCRPRSRCW